MDNNESSRFDFFEKHEEEKKPVKVKLNKKAVVITGILLVVFWPFGILSLIFCIKMINAYNDGNDYMANYYYGKVINVLLGFIYVVVTMAVIILYYEYIR